MQLDHQIERCLLIFLWIFLGLIYPVIQTIKRRDLSVANIFGFLFYSILGPVSLLGFLFEWFHLNENKIVWRRKDDKYWHSKYLE